MTADVPVRCPWCRHGFDPGDATGRSRIYCPSCGRVFGLEATDGGSSASSPGKEAAGKSPDVSNAGPEVETPAGRRFGDYDIIGEIARGGMGVVYLARQRSLRRMVALKLLRAGDSASPEERERLLREAKAAAGLSHPNIVPVHEFSLHRGQPYFTMDFIEGKPLDRLLEGRPLAVREAVGIIETVAKAVAFAHSRGVVHRDLKPANIILAPDGRPMITDFGLAAELADGGTPGQRMTAAGAVMGTLPYAPPEQAAGRLDQIRERSDVYAMGAILYEMVTGRPPFSGFTQFELMRRVISQDPAPPRRLNPRVSRDVETMILKCLEKDPRRRYTSARALADDCRSFLNGEVIAARPATSAYRCWRLLSRRPLHAAVSVLALTLTASLWLGSDHLRAMARDKEVAEQELVSSRAAAERVILEKEETERRLRREWRVAYRLGFDYAFRWEGDLERARRMEIPWLNRERASLL
ncbi:MAG: serine/threonine protein kinase, partial [Planctomycetota bacterium]|nr:serine/threonine protein kinase [Planctomycetota bacterium]